MRKVVFAFLAALLVLHGGSFAAAIDINVSGYHYADGTYKSILTPEKINGAASIINPQRLKVTPIFNIVDGLNRSSHFDDSMSRAWGTKVLLPQINVATNYGNFAFTGAVEKQAEGRMRIGQTTDMDNYIFATMYKKNDFQSGMLYKFLMNDNTSSEPFGTKLKANVISPYFKANIGKAYVEGQIYYLWGELRAEEKSILPLYDKKNIDSYSWYLMGKYNIGPGYVGAMYAYVRGDDPDTDDIEGTEFVASGIGGGADWNPCLILWNSETNKRMGDVDFDLGSSAGYEMTNASLYQLFAGTSLAEKISVSASYTFARANEKQGRLNANYGQEVDLTATYKIYDNLDYMVGFGYLITGDWYKGTSDINQVDDDYLLLNKLTLNF